MAKSFKVVKIISEFELVISGGSKDGIKVGDEAEVYEVGQRVYLPGSSECIGTLDHIKCQLIITRVYEQMSVCKNKSVIGPINTSIVFPNQKLPVNASDIESSDIEENNIIQIGDLVKLLPSKNS